MKTITLNKVGYLIKGVADVKPWGGRQACIDMEPFKVKHLKDIKENLNDGGFGVESINGAVVYIYEDFGECQRFLKDEVIGTVSESTFDYINRE